MGDGGEQELGQLLAWFAAGMHAPPEAPPGGFHLDTGTGDLLTTDSREALAALLGAAAMREALRRLVAEEREDERDELLATLQERCDAGAPPETLGELSLRLAPHYPAALPSREALAALLRRAWHP